MKIKLIVVSLAILLAACSSKKSDENNRLNGNIVFINVGRASRGELAKCIAKVSECKPKVIGLHAIFESRSNLDDDSALAKAIGNAGNVILSTIIVNGKLINSDSIFLRASHSQGLVSYGSKEGVIYSYETFTSYNDQLLWSFPATVAGDYQFEMNQKLMDGMKGNQPYKILTHSNSLRTYSITEIMTNGSCGDFKNKMVLMGYLGPTSEDKYPVNVGGGDPEHLYGVVILANILTSLLEGEFEEAD